MIEQPNFLYKPDGTRVYLYQHQLKSVYDLERFEREKKTVRNQHTNRTIITSTDVGLFRDIPGYGKTLSMCVMIARDIRENKIEWDLSEPFKKETHHVLSSCIHQTRVNLYDKCDCSLIVCSTNLLHQWKKELDICGIIYLEINNSKTIKDIPNINYLNENYQVILISSNFLCNFLDIYGNYAYKRFILDEVADTRIIGLSNRDIIANFYWLISATIYESIRRTRNTWLHLLLPINYFDYNIISVMNDPNIIMNSIVLPTPKYLTHLYRPNIAFKTFKNILDNGISELLSNGNINAAMSMLNVSDDENIFQAVIRRCDEKINRYRNYMSPGPLRTKKIDEATKEKENILSRIDDISNQDCNICYCKPIDYVVTPCCYQLFCSECFFRSMQTIKMKCCLCKCDVDPSKLIRFKDNESMLKDGIKIVKQEVVYIDNENVDEGEDKGEDEGEPSELVGVISNKSQQETIVDVLLKILKFNNRKILIFSEYDSIYDYINTKTIEKRPNTTLGILKGHQVTREKIIDDFKNGHLQVLYLNSISNASGINLPEATDILLCHNMPTAMKDQIIGRAIRIGCDHDVTIHQFIRG